MTGDNKQKKAGPDWRLIFCLYLICFSPVLFGPFINSYYADLSEIETFNWLKLKTMVFIEWADLYFSTDDPRRTEIEEHVFYIKKFARLTLFLSVFILLFFKLGLRSNRLDVDLSGTFKNWQNLTSTEEEKKSLSYKECSFYLALVTTIFLITDIGIFSSVPSDRATTDFGYLTTIGFNLVPLLSWRIFLTIIPKIKEVSSQV